MTLGTDLVALAVDERQGVLRATPRLGFALAGAELCGLALARRIEAGPDGRLTVLERMRTGDRVLDALLTEAGR